MQQKPYETRVTFLRRCLARVDGRQRGLARRLAWEESPVEIERCIAGLRRLPYQRNELQRRLAAAMIQERNAPEESQRAFWARVLAQQNAPKAQRPHYPLRNK